MCESERDIDLVRKEKKVFDSPTTISSQSETDTAEGDDKDVNSHGTLQVDTGEERRSVKS